MIAAVADVAVVAKRPCRFINRRQANTSDADGVEHRVEAVRDRFGRHLAVVERCLGAELARVVEVACGRRSAVTCAPRPTASCVAAAPTAPAAPRMSTVEPFRTPRDFQPAERGRADQRQRRRARCRPSGAGATHPGLTSYSSAAVRVRPVGRFGLNPHTRVPAGGPVQPSPIDVDRAEDIQPGALREPPAGRDAQLAGANAEVDLIDAGGLHPDEGTAAPGQSGSGTFRSLSTSGPP